MRDCFSKGTGLASCDTSKNHRQGLKLSMPSPAVASLQLPNSSGCQSFRLTCNRMHREHARMASRDCINHGVLASLPCPSHEKPRGCRLGCGTSGQRRCLPLLPRPALPSRSASVQVHVLQQTTYMINQKVCSRKSCLCILLSGRHLHAI